MTLQASSVLSSVPEQDWSDIDPALRPFASSSVAPSTIADGDGDGEVNEGEKLTYKRTSEVWDHSFYSRHKITKNSKGQSIWRCKYCSKTYVDTGGNGNAKLTLSSIIAVKFRHKTRSVLRGINKLLIWPNFALNRMQQTISVEDLILEMKVITKEGREVSLIQLF